MLVVVHEVAGRRSKRPMPITSVRETSALVVTYANAYRPTEFSRRALQGIGALRWVRCGPWKGRAELAAFFASCHGRSPCSTLLPAHSLACCEWPTAGLPPVACPAARLYRRARVGVSGDAVSPGGGPVSVARVRVGAKNVMLCYVMSQKEHWFQLHPTGS